MNTINEKINDLKKYLYFNKLEETNIDKVNIEKSLFKLLRECITNKVYEIEVGQYYLNISPNNLSVRYENNDTLIEVSNEDIHIEDTQERNVEYFVIIPIEEEQYNIEIPAIMVDGVISTYDNTYEEIYEISLSDDIEDDIKNYLTLSSGFTYAETDFSTKDTAIIKRNITPETPYVNIYELLNKKIVKPVTYDIDNDNYIKRTITSNPLNYENIIPKLDDKKLITSYLYGLIIEFYTEYINNNN